MVTVPMFALFTLAMPLIDQVPSIVCAALNDCAPVKVPAVTDGRTVSEPLVLTITLPVSPSSTKLLPEIVMFEDETETSVPSAPKTSADVEFAEARSSPVPKFARIAPEVADN